MAHLHTVQDDDLYFSIDPPSKAITFQGDDPLLLAVGDHNSEHYTFEMPRYIDGHDMTLCNQVEIHYINIASGTNRRSADVYEVKDLQVADGDDSTVMFTWLLSQNASMYVGSLSFAIHFKCKTGTKIDYSWRTGIFSGINVTDSTDNSNLVVEQYSDILQEWYMELLMSGTEGVNMVEAAAQEAIEAIQNVPIANIESAESKAIQSINTKRDEVINTDIPAAESKAIQSINKKQDAIVDEVLDKIPVYSGEAEDLISFIPTYLGETEEVI